MEAREISKTLKKLYFSQSTPALVLLTILYFFRYALQGQEVPTSQGNTISYVLIALTAVIGIAFPVFFRSYFVFKIRDKHEITTEIFIRFEKIMMIFALLTPYFLVLSFLLNQKNTTNIVITLFAIYAAYYYFPSVRKIQFEMKIFRIRQSETKEES